MSAADGNGTRYVSIRWLVGILAAVLIMSAGAFFRDLRTDVSTLQAQQAVTREAVATAASNRENDRARLERIEAKLDRLLEGRDGTARSPYPYRTR